MNKLKPWFLAARPRTLPLSLSGIVLGNGIAYQLVENFSWQIFVWCCITTVLLQILSNFANDYGDGTKGTDNNRKGEQRAVASGLISPKQMKQAVLLFSVLSLLSSVYLIFLAFPNNFLVVSILLLLAISAIVASIKYTVGKNAYGYLAMGDFFVFVFFGLFAVVGSYFAQDKEIWLPIFIPASAIGLLCVAVLNLNNMRDAEDDLKNNKKTLANQLGRSNAKIYHSFLIVLPFVLGGIFVWQYFDNSYKNFAFFLVLPILAKHLNTVLKNQKAELLDAELKKVALATFLYALLFVFGML